MGLWLFYLYITLLIVASMQYSTPLITTFILFATLITATDCNQPITYPPGGYNYPQKISAADDSFFNCPLRNTFSRFDSFWAAYNYVFYNAFDEPNLSLRPLGKDVFRLTFAGYHDTSVVITLTKSEMIVKKGTIDGERYLTYPDERRLTDTEKYHFHILSRRFPLEQQVYVSPVLKKSYDSLVKANPQLLDVNYYKYLLKKATPPPAKLYEYTVQKFNLPYKEFKRLVSIINNSGYWKSPYKLKCDAEFYDGYAFSLEANTKTKYNFVKSYNCNEDKTKFLSVCQEIVKSAGLEKQLDLLWFNKPKKPETSKPPVIPIQDVTLVDVKPDSNYNRKKATRQHK